MRTYSRCTTPAKAMNSNAPKLRDMVMQLGEKSIEAYLKLWIIDLDRTLDLKKPLNEDQIDDIAFRILDKYRSLNIADINLVFSRAKNGEVENLYDRISVPNVMKWFRLYFDERCSMAAELSYQHHVQVKSAFSDVGKETVRAQTNMREAAKWYQDKKERAEAQERVDHAKKNPPKQEKQK